MAKMFDSDASPQDAGFNALRIAISVVAEYEPMIENSESTLAWAITDLRSIVFDHVEAMTTDDVGSMRYTTRELLDIVGDVIEAI